MTDVLITGSLPMHHMALEIARRTVPPEPIHRGMTTLLADPADHPFDIGRHMLTNIGRMLDELSQTDRPPSAARMNRRTLDAMKLASQEGRPCVSPSTVVGLPSRYLGLEIIVDDGLANGCVEIE